MLAYTRPWNNSGEATFDFPKGRHYNVSWDSWKFCPTIFFGHLQHIYPLLIVLCEIRENDDFRKKNAPKAVTPQFRPSPVTDFEMLVRSAE